ncbi:MAG: sporulation protein YunB [Bacteroides sp.]|nr:sporulation protein YunB [Eubacterium sp.]MCM1417888.1 sporulation protein YunB [Roseburia sp.]MCM1461948.1 sporulation protein YunB [Bacteroides sp.]
MLQRKRGGRLVRLAGTVLVILGAAAIVFLIGFDLWIKPTIERATLYQCEQIADRAVSRAICSHMADTREGSASLVRFLYDESGRIGALETDPVAINRLKAMVNEFIDTELSSAEAETVAVSLGTLTGISYLYGRGDDLVFTVKPIGAAQTRLRCTFEHAGINQTMHSIILEVSTVISPLIPGFTESLTVTTEFILAQTVLIGEVPDTFSNIILDQEHFSELADFNLTG